jgi:hypothetical protein
LSHYTACWILNRQRRSTGKSESGCPYQSATTFPLPPGTLFSLLPRCAKVYSSRTHSFALILPFYFEFTSNIFFFLFFTFLLFIFLPFLFYIFRQPNWAEISPEGVGGVSNKYIHPYTELRYFMLTYSASMEQLV